MRNTLAIAKRQFASYFNGSIAYIVICTLLLLLGFFFWKTFFLYERATVRDLFQLMPMALMIAAPALTMGLLADEKRNGTLEVLLTMPVSDAQVIVGKYLGVLGLYAVLLVLTLPYPVSVSTLGPLDWGQTLAGYLGLFFLGGAMLAIGLLTSSFTENQLVAFFVALGVNVVLVFLFRYFLPLLPAAMASTLEWISLSYHMDSMARGVIDTRDLVFFLSVIVFSLMFAFRALESRRWS